MPNETCYNVCPTERKHKATTSEIDVDLEKQRGKAK